MPAGHATSCTTSLLVAGASALLNVVDDVTRECLAAVPNTSISGKRVVRELMRCLQYFLRAHCIALSAQLLD